MVERYKLNCSSAWKRKKQQQNNKLSAALSVNRPDIFIVAEVEINQILCCR